jgi:hypothetical protein
MNIQPLKIWKGVVVLFGLFQTLMLDVRLTHRPNDPIDELSTGWTENESLSFRFDPAPFPRRSMCK